jgi:hypothetical protein
VQLAELERVAQRRGADRLMEEGVRLADPARLDVRGELLCGRDVFIDVNCVFEGRVVLDDRVAEETTLSAIYQCHLTLLRPDAAIAKTLAGWQFVDRRDGVEWHGLVAGPDRLRFLGTVTRYVGLLTRIELCEVDPSIPLQ